MASGCLSLKPTLSSQVTEPAQPPPPRPYTPPSDTGRILLEDEQVLVADKPSGLLSVPGRGDARQDCLKSRLEQRFGKLYVVHRLDMDTSGLTLFARTPDAGRKLSSAFEAREVSKRYHALVAGVPPHDSGSIELPIGRDWEMRPLRKIDHESGQPSLTRWTLMDQYDDCALLDLEPVTGRTHQLRLHLAAIGHPILGDALYGDPSRASRLCLHASKLVFPHPGTGALTCVKSTISFGNIGRLQN